MTIRQGHKFPTQRVSNGDFAVVSVFVVFQLVTIFTAVAQVPQDNRPRAPGELGLFEQFAPPPPAEAPVAVHVPGPVLCDYGDKSDLSKVKTYLSRQVDAGIEDPRSPRLQRFITCKCKLRLEYCEYPSTVIAPQCPAGFQPNTFVLISVMNKDRTTSSVSENLCEPHKHRLGITVSDIVFDPIGEFYISPHPTVDAYCESKCIVPDPAEAFGVWVCPPPPLPMVREVDVPITCLKAPLVAPADLPGMLPPLRP